jgi:hypothetical protein
MPTNGLQLPCQKKQDADKNSSESSNLISKAEDVFRYSIKGTIVTDLAHKARLIGATQDHMPIMQDFPPKELHLKVGMCVSIANNSVDHYWVNNMKANLIIDLPYYIHSYYNCLFFSLNTLLCRR